ncbi:MAG TPA: YraN family protein [Planctomycetaceae bacterium]|nr:YraN family protein [Planctomycetaceae bacterium]
MRFRSIRPKDRLGRKGEKAAIAFLERKGYRILEQNLRLDPFGELDLVAEDGECLVFIEVKTRKSDADGGAVEAVGMKKRRSLHRLAMAYMNRRNRPECPMRFDVVAITWPEKAAPRIDHYRDAFDIPPPLKTDNK